jgi:hypothetical protein
MKTNNLCPDMPMECRFHRHIHATCRCHRHIVAPPVVDAHLAGKLEEVGYGG